LDRVKQHNNQRTYINAFAPYSIQETGNHNTKMKHAVVLSFWVQEHSRAEL